MKESRVKELLSAYQNDGDMAARDTVILAHLNVCDWWVGKYRLPSHIYFDKEDLKGVAHVALMECCDLYDPTKENANFSSLAIARIRSSIHREVVVNSRVNGREAERWTAPIDRHENSGAQTKGRNVDAPRDVNCQYGWDSLDQHDHTENALVTDMAQRIRDIAPEVLTPKEYQIYKLRFEMGLTYGRIGRQLGVSRQAVGFIGKRAQGKLREAARRTLRLQEGE